MQRTSSKSSNSCKAICVCSITTQSLEFHRFKHKFYSKLFEI